jgi:hypothetical protein
MKLFPGIITVGIVEFIVKETNRYATQPLQNFGSGRMKHRGGEFPTIPFQEVLLKLVRTYCSKKSLLMTPDYPGIVLYNKHVPLLKCFYFLDNNSVPPFMNKRLYKVKTIFDDANRK